LRRKDCLEGLKMSSRKERSNEGKWSLAKEAMFDKDPDLALLGLSSS
jgi:hypothetical protein